MKVNLYRFVASSLSIALVAACGGGGGGGVGGGVGGGSETSTRTAVVSTGINVTATPPPSGPYWSFSCYGGPELYVDRQLSDTEFFSVCNPSPLAISIPTPTHAVGSEELAAFKLLNQERARCEFGLLAQDAALDKAAKVHAHWSLVNNIVSHFEDATVYPNGFTGYAPQDRAKFQGYQGFAGEVIAPTISSSKIGWGEGGIRPLLNAPYHLSSLMSAAKDIGMAVRSNTDAGSVVPGTTLVANPGFKSAAGQQLLPGDSVVTYPCDGSTGVAYTLRGEVPNPVPGRNLSALPIGVSIIISVRLGQALIVSSIKTVEAASGAVVALRPMVGGANGQVDPNTDTYFNGRSPFNLSSGYVAADAPMKPSTAYKVTITGTNNGVAFTKVFTYTTGALGMLGV
jgi:uncharacterized protein YkwD